MTGLAAFVVGLFLAAPPEFRRAGGEEFPDIGCREEVDDILIGTGATAAAGLMIS